MHLDTVWPSPMAQPQTVSYMLQIKLDFPDSPVGSP